MNNTIAITEEQLLAFLQDYNSRELCYHWREYSILLVKSAYDENTEFLYSTYQFHDGEPHRIGEELNYIGLYSRLLQQVIGGVQGVSDAHNISREQILKTFEADVRQRICKIVDHNPVPETKDAEAIRDNREYFEQHGAQQEALTIFYDTNRTPVYSPSYRLQHPATDVFIRILHHHEEIVHESADRFVRVYARSINNRLWQIGLVTEKLAELNAMPGEHHMRRAIASCIDLGIMKTVGIEVVKGGQSITGKIEAVELKRANGTDYSTWRMDAPTRRDFERVFGQSARLMASDIQRIHYRRKALYEKESQDFIL